MRAAIVVTIAVALALGSTAVLAQSRPAPAAQQTALAPGQPAGLKQAQNSSSTLPIILGVGLVAGGIALAASGGNDDNRNPIAVTTTSAP